MSFWESKVSIVDGRSLRTAHLIDSAKGCRDGAVAHAQAILLAKGCVRASRLRNTRNNARLLQATFSCSLKHQPFQHMMRTRVMYGNGELI
jgi:hypothetical protein